MKLLCFGHSGAEEPASLDADSCEGIPASLSDIAGPHGLDGQHRQTDSLRPTVFWNAHLIDHISRVMTPGPNELFATGAPRGIEPGMSPPHFLSVRHVATLGSTEPTAQRHLMVPA